MPRDTRTGWVLEQMIVPSLMRGGYSYTLQVNLGQRLGSGRHFVDAVAEKADQRFLISVKWQQVAGTAEQKVPFEAICLIEAMENNEFAKAYIVLGGEGWKLRNFYTTGGLSKYLNNCNRIEIISLEGFVAKANKGFL